MLNSVLAAAFVGGYTLKRYTHAGLPRSHELGCEAEMEEEAIGEIRQADIKDHLDIENGTPPEPIIASGEELETLKAVQGKLAAVARYVGQGNFNIIDFDRTKQIASSAPSIGAFTDEQIAYIEALFYRDAKEYGFYGEKVLNELTFTIDPKDVVKIPASGHYLYKEQSVEVFNKVKKDIGETIFLTSGVRGIPKQIYLFLSKTVFCKGNYSEASRSLAPAGYSYHAIGDFDVGKVGLGERNFTQDFAATREYEMLMQLGYIAIRYPRGNPFGVYFEPWHVEVV
jgi:hypothetical protein